MNKTKNNFFNKNYNQNNIIDLTGYENRINTSR